MDDGVEVRWDDGLGGLFATHAFEAGSTVMKLRGITQVYPSRYSIQVAATAHLAPPLRAVAEDRLTENYRWCFINHSCAPSTFIDVEARAIVALHPLAPGDELTFDYNTTEWNMADPFTCRCGAAQCQKTVRGYRHLTPAQREALGPYVAAYLPALLRDLAVEGP